MEELEKILKSIFSENVQDSYVELIKSQFDKKISPNKIKHLIRN